MKKFTKDGRLLIPLSQRKVNKPGAKEDSIKYVVTEAFCPNGCDVIDRKYQLKGFPGIRIKFARPGAGGVFVISAVEGDFEKIMLSGELKEGVKDELYCPHCGVMFEKLIHCGCKPDADMVVLGLTPKLDFNNAITFCNVTGCENGTFVKSGVVLRHIRLTNW